MHTKQYKEGALTYSIRRMSKEEYDKEFPDSEEEQEMPTTGVGDPEEDEDQDSEESTADQLADAFRRVTNNQVRTDIRDVSRLHVSERKANAPAFAPTPEATGKTNETSEQLAAVMQKLRS
jgi:hypothetical protein